MVAFSPDCFQLGLDLVSEAQFGENFIGDDQQVSCAECFRLRSGFVCAANTAGKCKQTCLFRCLQHKEKPTVMLLAVGS